MGNKREEFTEIITANIWNHLDEYGRMLQMPRLLGEEDEKYKERLLSGANYVNSTTEHGFRNYVAKSLGLLKTIYADITKEVVLGENAPDIYSIFVDDKKLTYFCNVQKNVVSIDDIEKIVGVLDGKEVILAEEYSKGSLFDKIEVKKAAFYIEDKGGDTYKIHLSQLFGFDYSNPNAACRITVVKKNGSKVSLNIEGNGVLRYDSNSKTYRLTPIEKVDTFIIDDTHSIKIDREKYINNNFIVEYSQGGRLERWDEFDDDMISGFYYIEGDTIIFSRVDKGSTINLRKVSKITYFDKIDIFFLNDMERLKKEGHIKNNVMSDYLMSIINDIKAKVPIYNDNIIMDEYIAGEIDPETDVEYFYKRTI